MKNQRQILLYLFFFLSYYLCFSMTLHNGSSLVSGDQDLDPEAKDPGKHTWASQTTRSTHSKSKQQCGSPRIATVLASLLKRNNSEGRDGPRLATPHSQGHPRAGTEHVLMYKYTKRAKTPEARVMKILSSRRENYSQIVSITRSTKHSDPLVISK